MSQINSHSLLIRAATMSDIGRLLEMSELVGSGMTSMPRDRDSWVEKISRSVDDFQLAEPRKSDDIYFMVMEDLSSGRIVGCCAVYTGVGMRSPFYSYKLSTLTSYSEKLDLTVHARILNLVNDFNGKTEIGSLFLLPEYRIDGIGKFLSRSRFLLLADFPTRFSETIFAEMRGWLDEDGNSPFWQHLGSKFFGISFAEADLLNAVEGHQFISDLMPKYPVYLDLLPSEAQDSIGKEHVDTGGALHILNKEGFGFSGYVDIFDAGPTIESPLENIKTVSDSRELSLGAIVDEANIAAQQKFIISNCQLHNYRMIHAGVAVDQDGTEQITISKQSAAILGVKPGDTIRIVEH